MWEFQRTKCSLDPAHQHKPAPVKTTKTSQVAASGDVNETNKTTEVTSSNQNKEVETVPLKPQKPPKPAKTFNGEKVEIVMSNAVFCSVCFSKC